MGVILREEPTEVDRDTEAVNEPVIVCVFELEAVCEGVTLTLNVRDVLDDIVNEIDGEVLIDGGRLK